jgi:hypothetical protein
MKQFVQYAETKNLYLHQSAEFSHALCIIKGKIYCEDSYLLGYDAV